METRKTREENQKEKRIRDMKVRTGVHHVDYTITFTYIFYRIFFSNYSDSAQKTCPSYNVALYYMFSHFAPNAELLFSWVI